MPTYEYVCHSCGHAWEAVQRISADPLTECPSCKKQTAERQISVGAGFILKGGGWYSDLYSSPKPKPAPAPNGDGKSSEKTGEAKAESKPDAKPAEKSEAAKPASSPPPAKTD
jgi:putative FmdB family regulatory protein